MGGLFNFHCTVLGQVCAITETDPSRDAILESRCWNGYSVPKEWLDDYMEYQKAVEVTMAIMLRTTKYRGYAYFVNPVSPYADAKILKSKQEFFGVVETDHPIMDEAALRLNMNYFIQDI